MDDINEEYVFEIFVNVNDSIVLDKSRITKIVALRELNFVNKGNLGIFIKE